MKRMKVVRVTKDEFELDDGTVQPMLFDFDEVPTVEELQRHLDNATKFLGIKVEDDGKTGKNKKSV